MNGLFRQPGKSKCFQPVSINAKTVCQFHFLARHAVPQPGNQRSITRSATAQDKFLPHPGNNRDTDSAIAATVNCSRVACTSAGVSSPDRQLSSQARLNISLPALLGGGREKNGSRKEFFEQGRYYSA